MLKHISTRLIGTAAAAALLMGTGVYTSTAYAVDSPIDNASLEWGVSGMQQSTNAAGTCDYFTAGQTDGNLQSYSSQLGDVYIVKRLADGTSQQATSATRCDTTGSAGTNGQRILFTSGQGNVSDDGSATIRWTGAATVNSYGGMVPWYVQNPLLTVDASGNGTLTATVGGFASSESNSSIKEPLQPQDGVTIARFSNVKITDQGFTATPEYQGVDYHPLVDPTDASKGRTAASAITDALKSKDASWGSWPESFVDFQYRTGLSTYWHTSGGSADPLKHPEPLTVELNHQQIDGPPVISQDPTSQTASEGGTATFAAFASGDPTPTVQWQSSTDEGATWADVEGATSNQLIFNNVTVAAHNGLSVRMVATNALGTVTTSAVTLTVQERVAPTVTAQPENFSAPAGQAQYLNVTATGSALSYIWQRSTDGGETWVNYTGAADGWSPDWLTIPAADVTIENDGHQFRAVISNGVDDEVITSAAIMTVTTSAPEITWQPSTITAYDGMQVTLDASVTAAPNPTYIWEHSTDGGATWKEFVRIENSPYLSYQFTSTIENDKEQFRLHADNGIGTPATSGIISLTILPATERAVTPIYGTPLDPNGQGRLEVIGTGFDVTDADKGKDERIYLDIVEKGTRPGESAISADSALGRTTVHLSTFEDQAGAFTANIHFDEAELDATKRYELVIYNGTDLTNHNFDYVLPLLVQGQEPEAPTIDPIDPTDQDASTENPVSPQPEQVEASDEGQTSTSQETEPESVDANEAVAGGVLASTGGELSLLGTAAVAILAGASLMITRRRKTPNVRG